MLLCIALSASVNRTMKPPSAYVLSPVERMLATGNLSLFEAVRSRTYTFPLITIHVVAADTQRLLATPIVIRELWVRTPEQKDLPPDLEMFLDFGGDKFAPMPPDACDIEPLRGQPVPLARHAEDSEQISRLRMPGTSESSAIVAGKLTLQEALELEKGNPSQGWRVRARLELTVRDGDITRYLDGTLNARLVWEKAQASDAS
jgi:hypothetical protein